MDRMRYVFNKSFWAFSIVAVIFLAPSSGLITLTIPDEPYGSVLGIPDVPHIGKRASEDSLHILYDAAATSHVIHHTFLSEKISPIALKRDPHTDPPSLAQIRAPPEAHIA